MPRQVAGHAAGEADRQRLGVEGVVDPLELGGGASLGEAVVAEAIADVLERNHLPRLHVYGTGLFLVLHRPEVGEGGHVHYLELDQFIGTN